MTDTKLPKISENKKFNERNKRSKNKGAVSAKLLEKTTYDPLGLKHKNEDIADRVIFPKFNDNISNMEILTQNVKEENFQTSTLLRRRRTKYLCQLEALDEQWKLIEENENALRRNMKIFNHFLKGNLVKRERFEENIRHYHNMTCKYREEVDEMKKSISMLREIREVMKLQLENHSIYYKFLKNVISRKSEHKSVHSLIVRIDLLLETLEETTKKYNKEKTELDMLTKEIERRHSERIHSVDFMLQRIGILGQEHILAKLKSKECENLLVAVYQETAKLHANLVITKDFIDDFYRSICRRKGILAGLKNGDFEEQLMVIYTTLDILRTIIEKQKKERKSLCKENEDLDQKKVTIEQSKRKRKKQTN